MTRVTFRETSGRNRLQIGLGRSSSTLCRAPLVIEEPGCSVFGHFEFCHLLFTRSLSRRSCWSLALSAVFSAGGKESFACLHPSQSVPKPSLRHSSSMYCSEAPSALTTSSIAPSMSEGHCSLSPPFCALLRSLCPWSGTLILSYFGASACRRPDPEPSQVAVFCMFSHTTHWTNLRRQW